MFNNTDSVHLVHGPGSDAEAICLQVSRGYLESREMVAWLGSLSPSLARSAIGDLDGAALGNLRVWEKGAQGIHRLMPPSNGLLVMHGWCSPIGRATKAEVQYLEEILQMTECRVIVTSLGNQDAGSGSTQMTARSRERLEGMGLSTWFLSRSEDGPERVLTSSDSSLRLVRGQNGFTSIREP